MKRFKPSGAMVVAVCALVLALTGGATAAVLINGHDIKPGTVGHAQLAGHSVLNNDIGKGAIRAENLSTNLLSQLSRKAPSPSSGSSGAGGPQGPQGQKGDKGDSGAQGNPGSDGHDGHDGANPGVTVIDVPSIAGSSGHNPNPDSGDLGDAGWYLSGDGTGGTASLAGGELILTGVGVDANTEQGGIGIAKAFNRPLSDLDGVSFGYHILTPAANNTPLVHVTVTGLTADSKFASGFANLVYSPALNGATVSSGQEYTADAFLPGALWYSTTESDINNQGGQNHPQPLAFFTGRNGSAKITQVSLDNGGSSGASGTFTAGADDLVLGFRGAITRYDFGG